MAGTQEAAVDAVSVPETVRNYVGGEWAESDGRDEQTIVDPATGETLSSMTFTPSMRVDNVVMYANDAFKEWHAIPAVERSQYLFDLKDELEVRSDEIARALSREHGKTVREARGEIRRAIENVKVATGVPNMLQEGNGTVENVADGINESAVRQPLGVFAAIVPFKFLAMIPLWFLLYAVATGNTFIFKPSERVPLSSQIIFEAVETL